MTSDNVSAEQLAIALMAESRRLYGVADNVDRDRYDRNHGERELADRLAEWATQARQLGVELHQARAAFSAAKEEALKSESNIDDVREKLRSVAHSADPVLWANTLEEIAVMLDV